MNDVDSQQAAMYSRKAQANTTTALEFDNAMEPKTPVGDSAPGGSHLPTNRTEVERLGQQGAGSNKVASVQVISPGSTSFSHLGMRSPAEVDVTAIHTPRPGPEDMEDQEMVDEGDDNVSTSQRASGMLVQAQEAGKRAMRVTVERVQEMLGAAKEAAGIDKDKPIGDATREAVGSVSQKVQTSIEQTMASMNITANQAADGVVTAPSALQDFYNHGKKLVQEKENEKKGKGNEENTSQEKTTDLLDAPIEDVTAAVPTLQEESDQMVSSATWPQA